MGSAPLETSSGSAPDSTTQPLAHHKDVTAQPSVQRQRPKLKPTVRFHTDFKLLTVTRFSLDSNSSSDETMAIFNN